MYRAQKRSECACLFFLLLILGFVLPSAAPCAEGLRDQIVELAANHNFVVKGLEPLGDEPARVVFGDLRGQVSAVLRDYNFVFIEDGQGGIREVWIFDHQAVPHNRPTSPRRKDSYTVRTARQGSHHYVEAIVRGPNGRPHGSPFLIDTGATTVVLPASMIETLGFRGEDLRAGWAQTAGGRIAVKQGILASVKVGDAMAKNVAVSFIADQPLGNQRILGMSFIRSFRSVSFDDKGSELILFSQ